MITRFNLFLLIYLITFSWAFYVGLYESFYSLGVYLLLIIQILGAMTAFVYYAIMRWVLNRNVLFGRVLSVALQACIVLQLGYILAEKWNF